MIESDFDPQIGEVVQCYPRTGRFEGLFEIIGKQPSVWGPLLDLKRLKDGRVVRGVETNLLDYPQEERVRRAILSALSDCDYWPEDLQKGRFDLRSEEMYDGTPRTMVYFYLKPGSTPSLERARVWNDFYSKIEAKLEPFKDSSWDWLQFSTKEERSALSAAS